MKGALKSTNSTQDQGQVFWQGHGIHFGDAKVCSWWTLKDWSVHHWRVLSSITSAVTGAKQTLKKVHEKSALLSRQPASSHLCDRHDSNLRLRLRSPSASTLLARTGIGLLSVPENEIRVQMSALPLQRGRHGVCRRAPWSKNASFYEQGIQALQ